MHSVTCRLDGSGAGNIAPSGYRSLLGITERCAVVAAVADGLHCQRGVADSAVPSFGMTHFGRKTVALERPVPGGRSGPITRRWRSLRFRAEGHRTRAKRRVGTQSMRPTQRRVATRTDGRGHADPRPPENAPASRREAWHSTRLHRPSTVTCSARVLHEAQLRDKIWPLTCKYSGGRYWVRTSLRHFLRHWG
jgi:hypothetical protein